MTARTCYLIVIAFFLIGVFSSAAFCQTPFLTDNSETAPKHHLHFEFRNEFDVLQRENFPNLKQNTADFELDYGLLTHVEVGIEAPILTIISDSSLVPDRATGVGDTNLS